MTSLPQETTVVPPATETLKYGKIEVIIERKATATAADLQLPFYAGAKLHEGYTRRLSNKQDGKQLSYLAVAVLESKDAPEKVAADYARRLPGRPKPERLTDKQGARSVLAISSKEEVRVVTITRMIGGSQIKLTRAVKHTETLPEPQEQSAPDQPEVPAPPAPPVPPPPPLSIPPGGSAV